MKSFCQVWKYINCFAWMQAIFPKQHFVCDSVNVSNDHTKLNVKSDKTFLEKYTNCTFSAAVWPWKGQGHPKLVWTESKLPSFKFERPVNLQLWSWKFFNVQVCETDGQKLIITQTQNQSCKSQRKKERKKSPKNHEKPIKMPLGC